MMPPPHPTPTHPRSPPPLPFVTVSLTFLLCDLASLLSISSPFPLVLKQALYCVCSAEQAALEALTQYFCVSVCVCVSVPASLSDRVNPFRGPCAMPRPLFSLYSKLIGFSTSQSLRTPLSVGRLLWEVTPPSHHSPSTSQDQNAIKECVLRRSTQSPMGLCCRSMSKECVCVCVTTRRKAW